MLRRNRRVFRILFDPRAFPAIVGDVEHGLARFVGRLALIGLLGACGRSDFAVATAGTDGDETTTTSDDDDGPTTLTTIDDTTTSPTTFPSTTIQPTTIDPDTEWTSSTTFETDTFGFCGDNVVDFGEECDDGDFNDNDGCLSTCQFARCGDGIHWFGVEQCDDGNLNDNDACRNDCTLPFCGNGQVDAGEECDDGNFDDTDACLSNCHEADCGDGFVWAGMEDCDDGDGNGPGADCTPVCTVNVCGDGFQHATDEQCDPGAGNIGPGMQCRDGCILNVCGDGDEWIGVEECDDGNVDNTDACVACNNATCGDGFVWAGNEDCDDQDTDDLDRCHNDCSWHRVIQVALSGNHTCALFDSQLVKCWGNADHGRTGAGNEIDLGDDEPASVGDFIDVADPVTSILTGIGHTCVVHPDSTVRCFGRNTEGELGYGDTINVGDNETPGSVDPIPLGDTVTTINARSGSFHTCAWLTGGEARCWGRFENGRLGIPGLAEHIGDTEPASDGGPVNIGGTVVAFALGQLHTCALLEAGTVRCWGNGSDGALGYGNTNTIGDDEDPSAAGDVPVGATVVQLSAGWFHTCALTDAGNVRCWGRGNNGRLGYGNTANVGTLNTPASVGDVSVGGTVTQVAAGGAHTCALLEDGTVRCWGSGAIGALGYGNTDSIGDNELPSTVGPVPVGATATAVAAESNHTCIITDTGALRCWGHAGEGRLGYGNLNFIGDDEEPSTVGDVPLLP